MTGVQTCALPISSAGVNFGNPTSQQESREFPPSSTGPTSESFPSLGVHVSSKLGTTAVTSAHASALSLSDSLANSYTPAFSLIPFLFDNRATGSAGDGSQADSAANEPPVLPGQESPFFYLFENRRLTSRSRPHPLWMPKDPFAVDSLSGLSLGE